MADLCTEAKVREYIGKTDTTANVVIERLIDAVSAEIEAWCDQPIKKRAIAYRFFGPTAGPVRLPFFPIVSVGALTYANAIGVAATTVTVGTYDLAFWDGVPYLRGSFATAVAYTLTLEVGYDVVPADVEQVAIEMVAVRLRDSGVKEVGRSTLGKKSQSESVGGVTQKSTLYERPDWQQRLAPYRVVTI